MQPTIKKIKGCCALMACQLIIGTAMSQQYITGPISVYGYINSPATTTTSGGSVLVGSGGTWAFSGNLTSADKGAANTPNTTGRAEVITFDGTANYTGASITAGATGFIVDGYASATNQTAAFILPIGSGGIAYPVIIPAGATTTAAYFDGSGSNRSATINSLTANVYSPYVDLPAGLSAGSYTFSYPAGFSNSLSALLLSSGNTSASGTTGATTYSLLSNISSFLATAGTTVATLPTTAATQVYYGTASSVLPVTLASFTGTPNACTANLAWQTVTESNSAYYAIEHGSDGTTFYQVGKVASKNSLTGAAYQFNYPLATGSNFFRVKMIDLDGAYAYSQVVTVNGTGNCGVGGVIVAWPNPTKNEVFIQGLTLGSHIELINVKGQRLLDVIATGTSQQINLAAYANGLYMLFVRAKDGSTISKVKVVKE